MRLLLGNASRSAVVAAIAVEQDVMMQADEARIAATEQTFGAFVRDFARLRATWRRKGADLGEQHRELMLRARPLRGECA